MVDTGNVSHPGTAMPTQQEPTHQATNPTKSKDFFLGVFENAPQAMAIICPQNLTYQAVNDRFSAITGYSADGLTDRSVCDVVSPEDAPGYADELTALAQDGDNVPLDRKIQYTLESGKKAQVSEKVTRIAMSPHSPAFLLLTVEESLAKSGLTNIVTGFLEHTTDEIWAISPDNRILLANRVFCKKHDIRASLIGTPDSADLIRNRSSGDISMHEAVLDTGQTRRQMLSNTLPDGQVEMYAMVKFPLDLDGSGKRAVATIATNISDIAKSANKLRSRDNQIRHITDSLHVQVFRLDEDQHYKYINRTGTEWLNRPSEQIVGKHYADVIGAELYSERLPYLEKALGGKTVTHTAITTCPDGNTRHINVTFIPHRAAPGKPFGFIGVIEDITERKKIEDQLARASKLEGIGQLAAGIAHEINTPIQYIGDNLGFLRNASEGLFGLVDTFNEIVDAAQSGSDLTAAKARIGEAVSAVDLDFLKDDVPDAIEHSLNGVKDVARIITSMKDFSQPNSENRTPVDINQSLRNTLTITRNEWRDLAEIKEDMAEDLPQVLGFPAELNQVFLNIIVNAAHAIAEANSGKPETIGISTVAQGKSVVIRISDTGPGIPEDIRERIFEPFFTTKDVGSGTGQGLAMSWDIVVTRHGGMIDVESTPGEGTTFVLTLPC